MKESILKLLETQIQGEVHSSNVFKEFYSVDSSPYKIVPKIIVIPKDEEDVIRTVKIAKKNKVSVTVRGAGTGLVGGALNAGIIIDMKNFDSIGLRKNYAIVGAGVLKGIFDEKLKVEKKFFAPNPSIGSHCSVGGMLGNNSSGSKSLKYGSVIDNVIEITFVDGNGEKITLPNDNKYSKKILNVASLIDHEKFPKVTKNSSGYRLDSILTAKDVHKALVGSEGTLGIILSAKLVIKVMPKKRVLFVIQYDSIIQAAKNCNIIRDTNPAAMEFVDRTTFRHIRYDFGEKSKCLLFVEYDEKIPSSEKMLKNMSTGKIIKKLYTKKEIAQWWRYRDSALHYSIQSVKKEDRLPQVIEDVAVPLDKLSELFLILNEINKKYDTKSIVYGHAGNGNVHVRLTSKDKVINIKVIAVEYFDEIWRIGGTITAEHGDGLARSEFVKKQYGAKNYQAFQEMKKYFDPANILNPGKIITSKSIIIKNLDSMK